MKINVNKLYSTLFAIVIISQLYLPSFKFNFCLQFFLLIILLKNDAKVSPFFLRTLKPLLLLFLIGFISLFFLNFKLLNFIKDIIHFLKPILGIFLGYLIAKKIQNFRTFLFTFVFIGLFSAAIHFILLLFYSNLSTIEGIRAYAKDNFLELFVLFFLLFYKKFHGEEFLSNSFLRKAIVFSISLSCILYFSRTMMITSIILLLSFYGYTILTKKSVKMILFLLISIGLTYSYLYSIKLNRDAEGIENFFYKVKIAPTELFQAKIDRNNHRELWDHWRGYESLRALNLMSQNPQSFIFGMGYGSLVNLKFKAPLDNESKGMKYISELHNGYSYILYKTGIVGLVIYLFFLYKLYITIYIKKSFIAISISAIGIFFLFTTFTITGIYNTTDIVIFILGTMIFFKNKEENDKTIISETIN